MTTSKKIKAILDSGHYAAAQHEDGELKVFMIVYRDGAFQGTEMKHSINECMVGGFSDIPWSVDEIDRVFSNVTVVPRKITYFKPGDKVQVLEMVRDLPGFKTWGEGSIEEKMIGDVFEVVETVGMAYRLIFTEDNKVTFPHHVLAPAFEEEEEQTDTKELIAELERRGVLVDGKVLSV